MHFGCIHCLHGVNAARRQLYSLLSTARPWSCSFIVPSRACCMPSAYVRGRYAHQALLRFKTSEHACACHHSMPRAAPRILMDDQCKVRFRRWNQNILSLRDTYDGCNWYNARDAIKVWDSVLSMRFLRRCQKRIKSSQNISLDGDGCFKNRDTISHHLAGVSIRGSSTRVDKVARML